MWGVLIFLRFYYIAPRQWALEPWGRRWQKALDPTIQRATCHVTSPRWERRAFGKRCVRFCCPSLLPFVPLVSLGCEHREPAGRVRSKGPQPKHPSNSRCFACLLVLSWQFCRFNSHFSILLFLMRCDFSSLCFADSIHLTDHLFASFFIATFVD